MIMLICISLWDKKCIPKQVSYTLLVGGGDSTGEPKIQVFNF